MEHKKITGNDLIELGFRPGKWFGEALAHINDRGLSGNALHEYLSSAVPQTREPLATGERSFYRNIRAETPLEADNVRAVVETMEAVMTVPTAVTGAIMPDACPTGSIGQIPVGGVVATRNAIHPNMHSADICCSVMLTSLGTVSPKAVLDAAQSVTHFGGGGRDDLFPLPKAISNAMQANRFLNDEKSRSLARHHLGTQGDGNHFLYVGQSEKTGETILVTHHGSRGLGAYLYQQGMRVAENFRRELAPQTAANNAWIPFDDPFGQDYWEALQIVREWTKTNHGLLHDRIVRKAQSAATGRFWNEHNFVFRDDDVFYHAKGATPLDDRFVPDSYEGLRLIPLNMAEPILIVRGETTASNLGFAPHGAGRNTSRGAHKRGLAGKPAAQIFREETAGLDVRFYSGHVDISELPSAYKNADTVQRQMAEFGLGSVVDRILPYGCIMAGDWKKDAPWRKRKRQAGP
ncbi:RNA-splicing ligase RtcB [Neolewinella xylanilytica]|uniref:3'-phosphate/5'-hydroxy nucleic acid ligase n=1 Tax=Neolewinella xylanilytica TaxID=1514080 RepID=A0A2S6I5C4_9BACT|nr:RtcB family protein [Neolewinella xylanilytica]PPK86373.1 RNA-splicing ligase RtcB [Neolewinella xylanilytica]